MAIQTSAGKNSALTPGYTATATYAALFSTVPSSTAGTEITGGTPAYARKALTWSAPVNGVSTAVVTFDVPTGVTVAGFGTYTALTGGTYLDGAAVTSQAFSAQGTYQLTITYIQS